MAISFPKFPWLWSRGKEKKKVPKGSGVVNSLGEWGFGFRGESESVKFPSMKGRGEKMPSKSRDIIDREYDVVLVPSDGVSLSGSESDELDWAIGWLEPHAPDFQSDDDEDSFAVLVPCYRNNDCKKMEVPGVGVRFLGAVKNPPNVYSHGGKEYMEQWLSSLQKF